MPQSLPARKDVPVEHTWDADGVFSSHAAWETEYKRLSGVINGLSHWAGQLGESPGRLADWLDFYFALLHQVDRIEAYTTLSHTVDMADQVAAAMSSRAAALWAALYAAAAFAEPEMLSIGFERLDAWTASESRLALYAHYFDQLKRKSLHVRSAEVEELLGMVSEPFISARRIHGILSDADIRFKPAKGRDGDEREVAQGTIGALLSDPDSEIRRTAWESYADAFLEHRNTVANCLAAGVKQDVFLARARKYGSCLEAALSHNHIPVEVFRNLISTFRANLPTWHRYWEIRKNALGLDKLHVWDIKAPLSGDTPKISYGQAVDWICDGMKPLGDEYVSVMRKGALEERWVDIYPSRGKRQGAFSSGAKGTHPFILMSCNDDIYSLSTLAHELGHSMHSYYTWKCQPDAYSYYGLFVAEVASNFNQALVRDCLLKLNADTTFQVAVLEEAMSNFHRYFFIMPTLARFELEIHERVERGEALTASGMMSLMADLFREAYGSGVEMDEDRVGITWAQFSTHMYSNFYVYQYATGISGAHALAERILSGAPNAAEDYLAFLKAGGSLYPLDALKLAGVDLSSPAPVEQTFSTLARYVDRLAEMVG